MNFRTGPDQQLQHQQPHEYEHELVYKNWKPLLWWELQESPSERFPFLAGDERILW